MYSQENKLTLVVRILHDYGSSNAKVQISMCKASQALECTKTK